MAVLGLGIFPPYAKILTDLSSKLTIIVNGVQQFDVTHIHKIHDITTTISTTYQQIQSGIQTLNTHVTQATATLQAASSAGSTTGIKTALKLIADIIVEIKAGIQCVTTIIKIIQQCISIILAIALKVVELVLYVAMNAAADVKNYLKGLLNTLLKELNAIKAEMLKTVKAQMGKIKVNMILSEMRSQKNIIDLLYQKLTGSPIPTTEPELTQYLTDKNLYNTTIIYYDSNVGTLYEIKESSIYDLDIDALVAASSFGVSSVEDLPWENTI